MSIDGLERFPSARDIEKVARNPECETFRSTLAANVDIRKYAVHLGLKEELQSPVAIGRGKQVERRILGNDAALLLEKFVEDGKIQSGAQVEDLGSRRAKNRHGMEKAAARTDECIRALVGGQAAPHLLIHPVLSIPLGADTQFIEPDGLVLYTGRSHYEPLELKSYPFREGRTDPGDLQQARRQGAVYVHALRGRVAALGGSADDIRAQATLVFTRPSSLSPMPIYGESVQGEMRDVVHAVQLLDEARALMTRRVAEGEDIQTILPTLEINYIESCVSFCSLAKRCRDRAVEEQDVAVLGEIAARVLAPAERVDRAVALLEGAAPATAAEEALAARLRQLEQTLDGFQEAI